MDEPRGRYLWTREGEPDEDVARLEQLLAPLAHDGRPLLRTVPSRRRRRWPAAVAAAALVFAAGGALLVARRGAPPAPGAGPTPVLHADAGPLAESDWVEADTGDVHLDLDAALGRITLEQGGRLQVRRLAADVTRLYLARGRMSALISADARPRFFQVDTPAARCVDLGCRYTLEVDDAGDAFVEVFTGRVAFEDAGREVFVPAGATCRARAGGHAGTPRFRDAPDALVHALDAWDAAAGADAATRRALARAVFAAAGRIDDTVSVWHLLGDPDATVRREAEDALARLAGDEIEVRPAGAEAWKRALEPWWW